jgi:hypothetical protein
MMLNVLALTDPQFKRGQENEDVAQPGGACPQPKQIASFVLGLAGEEAENEVSRHVRNCERCRQLVNVISEVIETLN